MKFKHIIAIILLLSLIGNGIMVFYLTKRPIEKEIVKTQLDTLYLKRDSVLIKVNQSKTVIKAIEKQYEEDYNCLINGSVDSNYLFFINYLESQRERLFDSNNRDSVKAD